MTSTLKNEECKVQRKDGANIQIIKDTSTLTENSIHIKVVKGEKVQVDTHTLSHPFPPPLAHPVSLCVFSTHSFWT